MKKTAIITGATGNLGQEVVQRLYHNGYRIVATLGSGPAPGYFREMKVASEPVDLTDEEAVQAFVLRTLEHYPGLDAAIMLVGGFAPVGFSETRGSALDKMIGLNFKTAFFLTQALMAHFSTRPAGGQFVFIGTRPALDAREGKDLFAYALSKSLIFRLAECVNELGRGNRVTATVIVPSTIDTPANRAAWPQEDFAKWITPADLADTIAFVLSTPGQRLREGVLKMYNES